MACTSSCRTQDHATWGECVRAKNLKTAYCQSWKGADATAQRRADKELDAYAAARKEGIQPQSTKRHHIEAAVKASDQAGTAFRADL